MTTRLRLAIWAAVSKPDKAKPSDPDVKDKYSLKDQELLGAAFAQANDLEVAKIFRWPGHSRDESDVVQALEDFAAAGRFEYHELRELWRKKGFDILWCHNHSRLGRSFTLQSWVIENIIRSGARIYRHVGGWINEDDYGGQIALGGWANTQERGRRLLQNDAGLTERAKKGLNLNHVPFPHRVIRDPADGKALRMEIDPANRLFLVHLHELLMNNTRMRSLGGVLFERYGHVNPATGRAWINMSLYEMLHRPSFWGHTARKFQKHLRSLYRDCWGFDLSAPIPAGVEMYRNTHEPAYSGKQAEEVQSVIRYFKALYGVPSPAKVHFFTGLVYCPECFYPMHYNKTTAKHVKYYYIHCSTPYQAHNHNHPTPCHNTRHVRETDLFPFVDRILERAFSTAETETLLSPTPDLITPHRIEVLQDEIKRQNTLVDRLILQSAEASESMTSRFSSLIHEAAAQLDNLELELKQLENTARERAFEAEKRRTAAGELEPIFQQGRLWETEPPVVNRLLKDFLGNQAIFIADAKIIAVNQRPAKRSRKHWRA